MEKSKISVLIIDDEEEPRELLKKYIERHGYSAFTADNGLAGIEMLTRHEIGIVFCDIVMPKMDGIEFLREVQKNKWQVKVIMITGNPTVENCLDSYKNDACHYLLKPTHREEILQCLKKAEVSIQENDWA
ncbi:MAG: response regulator [Candidatus Omnitrophica bacterium]|nr:response regulator [Candidatus Omnitrophota bacterium]